MPSFPTKLTAALMLAAALAGCGKSSGSKAAKATTTSAAPTTTAAPAPVSLQQLGVAQSEVPAPYQVKLYDGGDQVQDQVTLDLCDAPFPSEELRAERYQVGVRDAKDNEVFSTEAVRYQSATGATQAMTEIRAAIAHCPTDRYVNSSVQGVPALKYTFKPSPDASWPATAGVDRVAVDAMLRDQQGHSEHDVAVYLQRGALLLGVYFQEPDKPLVPIGGQTTEQGIATLFATRLGGLPSA